jgi:transcriptional regulator with XRE-family HTH domain
MKLRLDKGMSYRQIAHETGLSLGTIHEYLAGVPKPLGKFDKAEGQSTEQQDQPVGAPSRLINPKNAAKLYALGLDEDFDDINKFIEQDLLPWHGVKRDFEWKLRMKLKANEFATYIEACMLDSMELKALKTKLGEMGGQPNTPEAAAPTIVQKSGGPAA